MKKITLLFACVTAMAMAFLSCSESDEVNTVNNGPSISFITPAVTVTGTTASASTTVSGNGGGAIIARGFCWAVTPIPTIGGSKTTETGTTGALSSSITGLIPNTLYFIRAYATTSQGTVYSSQASFTTGDAPVGGLPTVSTAVVSAITQTSASGGGVVSADGGSPILERGICWSTNQQPTTNDEKATASGTTGIFSADMMGLSPATTYYMRAYAINANGITYGNQVNFTTTAATTTGPVGGNAVCNGTQPTAVVTVTSTTGKIWMDRNLGASRAATSSKDFEAYGCLYQWGRGNDGHASINWVAGEEDDWGNVAGTAVNGTTSTLSNSDTPPNALFITDQTSIPYDWRSPKNDNLWQGANGINNPCPAGFRVPTRAEFQAEITAYSITGPTSAYNSIFKFPTAGDRAFDSGMIRGQGQEIWYWTSTTDGSDSYDVLIQAGAVYTNVGNGRAGGYSVRCIKN